ncbi:MAG: alpha/beta fold hydrolase [Candidatus Nanopelagicales bacterium]|nr:alpha/beta fold hydrolase [Candidatus Nanopelagicales bacterium]
MPLLPDAEPFSHDAKGPIGVVVSHGFTGQPKSIKPWAQALADAGFSVRAPRLPGHGTRWQDMNSVVWQDWYAEVERAYRELSDKCEQVYVMGLSMGGSLALRLAEEKGDGVAGLVVVNPAVHSERPDRFLLPVLRLFVPSFPGIVDDIKKPNVTEGGYPKLPLKAAYSLTHLWSAVKSDITEVDQPLLVFRSADDHVVEPSNTAWILANVSSTDKEEVVLHNSYHVATLDNDADLIFQGSVDFVKRVSAQPAKK